MLPLEPLAVEAAKLRTVTDGSRKVFESIAPPPRDTLTAARWALMHAIFDHFVAKDRLVYSRLAGHPDPGVVARSKRFAAEVVSVYRLFYERSAEWTPERAEADWPEVREALLELVDVVEHRLAREEKELHPLLKGAPPPTAANALGVLDWSAQEAAIRAKLGLDHDEAISTPS